VGITKGRHSSGPGSTHTAGYVPNFGKWRDPKVAKTFVSNPTKGGSGASTQWELPVRATHAKTHEKYAALPSLLPFNPLHSVQSPEPCITLCSLRRLAYDFTIAANGTILAMKNVTAGGTAVSPLRQWRRVPPFH
jgi:hypothetical protein